MTSMKIFEKFRRLKFGILQAQLCKFFAGKMNFDNWHCVLQNKTDFGKI